MTPEEIKTVIYSDLKPEPDLKNVFGLDLTDCIIEPVQQKYKDSNDAVETYELWTVFEEREDKNGYKIFFDEEANEFGLALQSDGVELIVIGYYGNFLETVYSL